MLSKLRGKIAAQIGRHFLLMERQWSAARRIEYRALVTEAAAKNPANLAARGFKVYSQNDEDGIIEAIFEKVGGNKTFLEVGIDDGTECNSTYLLLKGWRGAWAEADGRNCAGIRTKLDGDSFPAHFRLVEGFVTPGNVADLYRDTCAFLSVGEIDFFSLDIDSTDLFVMDALLASGARPPVVCVEYNGKFPPPLVLHVPPDHATGWIGDDYYGASLQAFHNLLTAAGYALVTCSVIGVNAFYVLQEKAHGLRTFEPLEVWQVLKTELSPMPQAHQASLKFLRNALHSGLT